ncbi:uncharacterized protein [Medicago truncatula]|uniref:uncharacterized protein isoform X2 n=1 Tax=Medicago truncatula TaxID=3880 RepID=UPI000D2F430C|nr:uncharacterized protein LOC11435663 isoform X2 [Medicago truncatula]
MVEKCKTTPSKQTKPSKRDVVLSLSASQQTENMTPSNEEMQLIVHEQKENYVTEFRNFLDDAWYTVSVTFEGNESLRVKYEKNTDEIDNLFEPGFFNSMEDLQEFETRFRPLSVQVQDHQCRELVPGVRVCASHEFGPDDLRFYDAHVVEPVLEYDPAVASFLEITRRRIESQSGQEMVVYCNTGIEAKNHTEIKTKSKMGYFERMQKFQAKRRAKRSVLGTRSSEGAKQTVLGASSPEGAKRSVLGASSTEGAKRSVLGASSPEVGLVEDKELKGKRNVCMILMGNLDKQLCPSTAVEFLYKHTQVSASVFIFPSLSSEIYTRGAIMLRTERDFQKLCDFLTNPKHIITSSTGRPWVIIEKQVGLKNIKASIGTVFPKSENAPQDGKSRVRNNLKIVYSGTQEFKTASAMRDLYSEFADHQERLHKKLAFLEGSVNEI